MFSLYIYIYIHAQFFFHLCIWLRAHLRLSILVGGSSPLFSSFFSSACIVCFLWGSHLSIPRALSSLFYSGLVSMDVSIFSSAFFPTWNGFSATNKFLSSVVLPRVRTAGYEAELLMLPLLSLSSSSSWWSKSASASSSSLQDGQRREPKWERILLPSAALR